MIRYVPTLVDLTSNFFVLCKNVKDYLYNYSLWPELSMNIHEGKGNKLSLRQWASKILQMRRLL